MIAAVGYLNRAMKMQLKIDARDLAQLTREIERLQKKLPRAISQGLNEGGDKVRTQVRRALKEQAGLVRYSSVTTRTRTVRAFPGAEGVAAYEIKVSGKATKMFEYKTLVQTGPGGGVTAWLWGVAHKFRRSFQGAGKIAGQLKMRTKGPHLPLRGFDGPNLAKEAVKGKSAEAFFASAETEVPTAVLKRIAKVLSG
jgi:hypothetical protein